MRRIYSLLIAMVCVMQVYAINIPNIGNAVWEGNTAIAILPVPDDLDYSEAYSTFADLCTLYIAENIVYQVEISYIHWQNAGFPSYIDLEYPDGKTTRILIQNRGSQSGSGEGIMVYLQSYLDD